MFIVKIIFVSTFLISLNADNIPDEIKQQPPLVLAEVNPNDDEIQEDLEFDFVPAEEIVNHPQQTQNDFVIEIGGGIRGQRRGRAHQQQEENVEATSTTIDQGPQQQQEEEDHGNTSVTIERIRAHRNNNCCIIL
uniref:Uncharacterized protein n=1 Tax=Meloidogyne hapla TaxID=6305 RepID=A0A1I8BYW4_MELHA